LSRCNAVQARPRSTGTGLRREDLVDDSRGTPGESKRSEQPQRNRVPVAQALVSCGGLQCVREGVAEVQDRTASLVERISETDPGLERRRPADQLVLAELPERTARQEPGLHHLRHAFAALSLTQSREDVRIDDDACRIVKRADEVLPGREVDGRLAADRGVDLPEQRRRHCEPAHAAQIGRGRKTCDVRGRAAAITDDRPAPAQVEIRPQPRKHRGRLRGLAARNRVHLVGREAEWMQLQHVFVGDHRDGAVNIEIGQPAPRDHYLERGEQHIVDASHRSGGDLVVQGLPRVEERPERFLVARKRTAASPDALPGRRGVDLDPDGMGTTAQKVARALGKHCSTAERDHGRLGGGEHLRRELLLEATELRLASLEELRDGSMASFELSVEIDEGSGAQPRGFLTERRLARAHEADEREVTPERTYLGDQSIRSR